MLCFYNNNNKNNSTRRKRKCWRWRICLWLRWWLMVSRYIFISKLMKSVYIKHVQLFAYLLHLNKVVETMKLKFRRMQLKTVVGKCTLVIFVIIRVLQAMNKKTSLILYDLILVWPHLQRHCCQTGSHAEGLGAHQFGWEHYSTHFTWENQSYFQKGGNTEVKKTSS